MEEAERALVTLAYVGYASASKAWAVRFQLPIKEFGIGAGEFAAPITSQNML